MDKLTHFSIIIGESQHGKDAFILSLDSNLMSMIENNKESKLKLGDGEQS